MMTLNVEQLLSSWAEWKVRREDSGLGYKMSSLVASDVEVRAPQRAALLPPGVDVDAELTLVDSAVSGLPIFHKVVIDEWYCRARDEQQMLRRVGVSRRSFFVYLRDAKELFVRNYHDVRERRSERGCANVH